MLLVCLCIANIVIEYDEVEQENPDMSGTEVFGEVMSKYWWSLVATFIATLFSIFVFGLCGFHTYLI